MNDKIIVRQVFGKIMPHSKGELQIFSGLLTKESGNFDSADILVGVIVGAALCNQNPAVFIQVIDGVDSLNKQGEIPLVSGEERGKPCQRYLIRQGL